MYHHSLNWQDLTYYIYLHKIYLCIYLSERKTKCNIKNLRKNFYQYIYLTAANENSIIHVIAGTTTVSRTLYSICKCLQNIKKKHVTKILLIAKATTNDFLYAENDFSLLTCSEFTSIYTAIIQYANTIFLVKARNDFPYLVFNNKTKNISYGDILLHICR